jgi:hypothetical protein
MCLRWQTRTYARKLVLEYSSNQQTSTRSKNIMSAIGSSASQEEPTTAIKQRDRLLNDRPTIDAALKSFATWFMLHEKTSSSSWTTSDVLKATRWLSVSINQHTVSASLSLSRSIKPKKALTEAKIEPVVVESTAHVEATREEDCLSTTAIVVAQVWNELVTTATTPMKQKVTKALGRTSLRIVWQDLDLVDQLLQSDSAWTDQCLRYVKLFELFLFTNNNEVDVDSGRTADGIDLSDARLIWDADGGQSELARRATIRHEQAVQRTKEMDNNKPSAFSSVEITNVEDQS